MSFELEEAEQQLTKLQSQQISVMGFEEIVQLLDDDLLFTKLPIFPIDHIKETIGNFTKFMNSIGRLSLLHADDAQSRELMFMLTNLQETIKTIIVSEIGKGRRKYRGYFKCEVCDEDIPYQSYSNNANSLLDHNHIHELFINNSCSKTVNINKVQNIEYKHNGIVLCNGNEDEEDEEEDINGFRFNFTLHYDSRVEKALYPDFFKSAMHKFDQSNTDEYTLQQMSKHHACCLLCNRDIAKRDSKVFITKKFLLDHLVGQKHLKLAQDVGQLNGLKNYHEAFLHLGAQYQAHQVYFRPNPVSTFVVTSLRCWLCSWMLVEKNLVKDHIESSLHLRHFLKRLTDNLFEFNLEGLQAEVYGPEITLSVKTRIEELKQPKEGQGVRKRRYNSRENSVANHTSRKGTLEEHIIIPAVEMPFKPTVLDKIPYRYSEHKQFLEEGDLMRCLCCNVEFGNDLDLVIEHICRSDHLAASHITQKRYSFHCDFCRKYFKHEFDYKKHFEDLNNRHDRVPMNREAKGKEYECLKCMKVIYGDEISLERHLQRFIRKKKKTEIELPNAVLKLFKCKNVIESKGRSLAEEANMIDTSKTEECCNDLETILKQTFSECKVYPFGSRVSHLGTQDSDLDMFVDIGGLYAGKTMKPSTADIMILKDVHKMIVKHKEIFNNTVQIPAARTPIIKSVHQKTGLNCDISFKNGLSVENTQFLRLCIEIQPITQPLILLLKNWSHINGFHEKISTYALAMLAIFYLQVNNYLLSVAKLRELNGPSPVIGGWETLSYVQPYRELAAHIEPYPHGLTQLLKDFFAFYNKFVYSEDVVCPLLGRTIKKELFKKDSQLPPEMKAYVHQLKKKNAELFKVASSLCVQDPFDLSHNLTKACQANTVDKFKTLSKLTLEHLEKLNE